jgi:hypothetical protein
MHLYKEVLINFGFNYKYKSMTLQGWRCVITHINPKRTKAIFWPIFEVWVGHCRCNICPKESQIFGEPVV